LLARLVRPLGRFRSIEFGADGIDLLVIRTFGEEAEGPFRPDATLPGQHWLIEGRQPIGPARWAGLPGAHLWEEIAKVFWHALDLDAKLLPIERHGLHDVWTIGGIRRHHRIH